MSLRTKSLIAVVVLWAAAATAWASHEPGSSWFRFAVFLTAILLSSRLKVALPQGDGSMSLNFPFLFLAIVQLSPLQAVLLAALSVAAQCRIRVKKLFTAVQILFNVANSMSATATAYLTYGALTRFGMALAPALSVAAAVFFACSTIPVALAIATSKGEPAFPLWKREFPWYLPFYLVGALIAAAADRIGAAFGASTSLLLIPLVYTVYRAYNAQVIRTRERQQHLEETEALHLRTIEGLAMAIEAKDQETHDHLFRVRSYVAAVGAALNLSSLEMRALHTAAFLHDIGKLAVPEHIINKPGKLTLEEFEKMKIHPVVGADILDRVQFPYPVVPIVRSHHEWWNGEGYPDGLKGEEIPIGARVLTVVDCFDALTSDRPYRKGKSLEDAMALVKSLSGTQFDPRVVEAFQLHCSELQKQVRKSEGREFVPLGKEISVWRGAAPGAGFEQDNTSSDPCGAAQPATDGDQDALHMLAAARQEAHSLLDMSLALHNFLSVRETLTLMTSRLRRLVPFDCCAVYFKSGDTVVLEHVEGEDAACFSVQPVPMGEGISGWVAQSGKAILNGNAAVEASYHKQTGGEDGLHAALSMPLFDPEANVFGVLTLYALRADFFSKDHLRLLQVMEPKLSPALRNARQKLRPKSDAGLDALTGLPNAGGLFLQLETEVDRCRRHGGTLAVVLCGLNSFQQVNDREGHFAGDGLLRAVAERFREGCRPYDTVARIGGDEFVFLLASATDAELSVRTETIAEMVSAARHSLHIKTPVSTSFGVCCFPTDGGNAEELLAAAERRMHGQKAARRRAEAANDPRTFEPVSV